MLYDFRFTSSASGGSAQTHIEGKIARIRLANEEIIFSY